MTDDWTRDIPPETPLRTLKVHQLLRLIDTGQHNGDPEDLMDAVRDGWDPRSRALA